MPHADQLIMRFGDDDFIIDYEQLVVGGLMPSDFVNCFRQFLVLIRG